MYTRLNEIPVYESREGEIEARYFNRVQIALKRLEKEIRLVIPDLKHLDLILQKDAWIIVDRVHNDVPIAAWSDFETRNRGSLHEPIKCLLRTYHRAADMILEKTLETMDEIIAEDLAEGRAEGGRSVLPFPRGK